MTAGRGMSLAVTALAVLAAAAGGASAMPFGRADRNGDGVVSYDEAVRIYPALSEAQFARFDTDRDGVIDRGEYPQLDNLYEVLVRSP